MYALRPDEESALKRVICGIVVAAVLGTLAPAFAQDDEPVVVDRIVARVNEDIVTLSDVIRFVPIYLQIIGTVDTASLQTVDGRNRLANDIANYLVDSKLVVENAREQQMGMSDAEVDAYLDNYIETLGMTRQQFSEALASEGVNFDDYREFMAMHLVRIQMIRSEVMGSVNISDEEVERVMAERYPDGLEDTYITTSHILVLVPAGAPAEVVDAATAQIATWRAEIAAGTSTFEDIASANNPDASANTGGRIGTFAVGELDSTYTREAMALEIGTISEPVRTPFGVHLIRLDNLERRAVGDAARIRDMVAYELEEAEARRQEALYLNRFRQDAFVEILVTEFDLR